MRAARGPRREEGGGVGGGGNGRNGREVEPRAAGRSRASLPYARSARYAISLAGHVCVTLTFARSLKVFGVLSGRALLSLSPRRRYSYECNQNESHDKNFDGNSQRDRRNETKTTARQCSVYPLSSTEGIIINENKFAYRVSRVRSLENTIDLFHSAVYYRCLRRPLHGRPEANI